MSSRRSPAPVVLDASLLAPAHTSAQCQTELYASNGSAGDFLGRSAAISGDVLMLGGHQLGSGLVLPPNVAPYFSLTLAHPYLAVFENLVGVLAPNGTRTAILQIPPASDPALAGLVLHHAVIAAATLGIVDDVSNPVSVLLTP